MRNARLRRKLEVDARRPRIIKTVDGAGHLFSAALAWSWRAADLAFASAAGPAGRPSPALRASA